MTDTEHIAHRVYDKHASGLRVTPPVNSIEYALYSHHDVLGESENRSKAPRVDGNVWRGVLWALLIEAVLGVGWMIWVLVR